MPKGPKPGAGPVTAWIVQALRAGDKTLAEVKMGCPYTNASVEAKFYRMVGDDQIKETGEKRLGGKGRSGQVYTLNQEVEFASGCRTTRYRAEKQRSNPIRGLDDVFQNIVAGRLAKTE